MAADWENIRNHRYVLDEPPSHWPAGVKPISLEGTSLLGIHEANGRLYWDGQQIATRIKLDGLTAWLAAIAAAGTFGTFLIELGKIIATRL